MTEKKARRAEDAIVEWVAQLEIRGVFLGGVTVSINRDAAPRRDDKELGADTKAEITVQEAGDVIKAVVSFTVEGKRAKARKAYVRVKGTYDVLFKKPDAPMEDRESAEVAKITTMIVWPYIRELVSSVGTRAGLPVPLPPLVKTSDLTPVED